MLAHWKAKRLCLQQQDNLECQDRLLGCGCITTRWLKLFWLTPKGASPSNDPAAGSLHYCYTSVEHISASNTNYWQHPWTEKKKFWFCPQLFVYGLVVRRPTVCPDLQPCHCVTWLAWARHHLHFRNAQWDRAVFTEESMINLSRANGHQFMNGRKCVMTTTAFKSVFVMLVEALWSGEASLRYLRGCCHWLAIPGDNCEERGCAVCAEPRTRDCAVMPVIMLPELCKMNSRSKSSTPCPGQPFSLICHQMNTSGTCWNVD